MRRQDNKRLSEAYRRLHGQLAAILYEEDPEGIGITIGSPEDEYDDYATRLVVSLREASGSVDVVVTSFFEGPSGSLVSRVTAAWHEYERAGKRGADKADLADRPE